MSGWDETPLESHGLTSGGPTKDLDTHAAMPPMEAPRNGGSKVGCARAGTKGQDGLVSQWPVPVVVDVASRFSWPLLPCVGSVLRQCGVLHGCHPRDWSPRDARKPGGVCPCLSLGEAQLVVGERVDHKVVDAPVEWSTRHAQESLYSRRWPLRGRQALQSGDDPVAKNSASSNTSPTGPFTAMLKSTPRSRRSLAPCVRAVV